MVLFIPFFISFTFTLFIYYFTTLVRSSLCLCLVTHTSMVLSTFIIRKTLLFPIYHTSVALFSYCSYIYHTSMVLSTYFIYYTSVALSVSLFDYPMQSLLFVLTILVWSSLSSTSTTLVWSSQIYLFTNHTSMVLSGFYADTYTGVVFMLFITVCPTSAFAISRFLLKCYLFPNPPPLFSGVLIVNFRLFWDAVFRLINWL